jgi:hypothetical protein
MTIFSFVALLLVQPPSVRVTDTVVTSRSRTFMRGDTLVIESTAAPQADGNARVARYRVTADTVTQIFPAPVGPVNPALAKALRFASRNLIENQELRRRIRH